VEPPTISPIKCNNLQPHDAAALEMLSPGVNLMQQQHKRCNGECSSSGKRSKASSSSSSSSSSSARSTSRWTGPKIRHRVRFIFSMCKALKHMLFRHRHHTKAIVVEPKLQQYNHGISLPGFPFVEAN
jgi:hypothetical protein